MDSDEYAKHITAQAVEGLAEKCNRQAEEIERLREALEAIRDQQGSYLPSPRDIARKALKAE